MSARYAIYFAPHPASLLWQLGCAWLGRDPSSGMKLDAPLPADMTRERYEAAAAFPKVYGFHATLKPPFVLATGKSLGDLKSDLAEFAAARRAFAAPALEVSRLGGFLALTLRGACEPMDRLAADCVTEFDAYRAPPSEAELAKRRKAKLSERQDELLMRWGYPSVMEEWRFHMTLTGSLAEPEMTTIERHLQMVFRPVLAAPLFVDRIALYAQDARDAPFRVDAWFPFGG